MRRVASFLLCGVAFAAGAADIWRWKDANGVTHYSDSPVPGAERVNVSRGPRPVPAAAGQPPGDVAPATAPSPEPVNYTRCAVAAPANDTVFQAVDSVSVSIAIEPELQPGHQALVLLNGGAYGDWPQGAVNHTLTGLFRGSYTLAVRVVDENDRELCSGRVVNFHVRQTSVQSPARQPPKQPPKK